MQDGSHLAFNLPKDTIVDLSIREIVQQQLISQGIQTHYWHMMTSNIQHKEMTMYNTLHLGKAIFLPLCKGAFKNLRFYKQNLLALEVPIFFVLNTHASTMRPF